MKDTISQEVYVDASKKVEELLEKTAGIDTMDHPDMILLDHYSNLISSYEEQHFPMGKPSLLEVVKLRMYEMELKQTDLAKILDVPPSRVSEYLKGKREITLDVAKKLHHKLNIDGDIILQ